jgi:trans-aconitate methyltransferase
MPLITATIMRQYGHMHSCLLPMVIRLLEDEVNPLGRRRIFHLGCGNGSTTASIQRKEFDIIRVDLSIEGIAQAKIS